MWPFDYFKKKREEEKRKADIDMECREKLFVLEFGRLTRDLKRPKHNSCHPSEEKHKPRFFDVTTITSKEPMFIQESWQSYAMREPDPVRLEELRQERAELIEKINAADLSGGGGTFDGGGASGDWGDCSSDSSGSDSGSSCGSD